MKALALSLIVVLAGCAHSVEHSLPGRPPDARTEAVFHELRVDLQAAMAHGDRARLEQLLAPSFVFVHSTGKLEPRSTFIDRTVSASATQPGAEIEFTDNNIRLYGNTAVWITHSRRPGTSVEFVATDVLVRNGDRWNWVSVQSTRTDH